MTPTPGWEPEPRTWVVESIAGQYRMYHSPFRFPNRVRVQGPNDLAVDLDARHAKAEFRRVGIPSFVARLLLRRLRSPRHQEAS
jgi:hypothetical protein